MGKKNGNNAVSMFDMQFVTATISTTLVLLLLGMVLFFVLTARNLSVYVRENINFSLVLDDGMDNRDILRLQRSLEKQPFVKEMTYISKEDALKDYVREMGIDPRRFAGFNPLRASLEIRLKSAYANTDSIERIEKLLGQESHIKDIVYQQELIDAINKNIGRISLLLLGLAALLLLISFALINNTIKLTIYAKRFLIHTMQLVGAGWGFIRRPFLWRNFWVGLFAGLLADAALWGLAGWLVTSEPGLVEVVTSEVMGLVAAAVLVAGVLITCFCALLSINKYLRMRTEALYR
ncbi:MAG: permease-like cell division protein FtsX [Candidatus Bacteroides intestinipullorum]|uniref:Cell division protein FtsX n=1 Tax=Candidatus Bacteroides intestinipullorum TaxID=2838471 RepID=A0A9E2KIE7_9BACE|nr:permease-like cell division protein FtsX [Candidatus Bacteroides intestinipullorum]